MLVKTWIGKPTKIQQPNGMPATVKFEFSTYKIENEDDITDLHEVFGSGVSIVTQFQIDKITYITISKAHNLKVQLPDVK